MRKKHLIKLAMVVIVTILTSCTTASVCVRDNLANPGYNKLIKITAKETMCVTDLTFKKMDINNTYCNERLKVYDSIIKKHNEVK